MNINLLNTASGLVPASDDDYALKQKLKVGGIYQADIKIKRNYQFLKKAFSLLNAAWSLMDERQMASWRSKDGFRAYLTVAAGFYDVYYNPRLQQFVEQPKSWAFDSMTEEDFGKLYDRMKDVIYAVLGDRVTPEVFERVLSNF